MEAKLQSIITLFVVFMVMAFFTVSEGIGFYPGYGYGYGGGLYGGGLYGGYGYGKKLYGGYGGFYG